jgi:hypothetical protein
MTRRDYLLSSVVMGLFLTGCRPSTISNAQTEAPVGPVGTGTPRVAVITQGQSSFVVLVDANTHAPHRLTNRTTGFESDPVLSKDGKQIAYSFSESQEGRSEVWIVSSTGGSGSRVSALTEDATMPAFAKGDTMLLYVTSGFNGHYSPIARPRRHDFDIEAVPITSNGAIAGATPISLTQQKFFDLRSIAVSDDGTTFLISTSGYPIGELIEEFDIASPQRIKRIFQPIVTGSPSSGAAYGKAAYIGMNIVFEAASEPAGGGNFDYNLYQMSGITGGEIVQLTHHQGMIADMSVEGTNVWILDQGQWNSVKLPEAR